MLKSPSIAQIDSNMSMLVYANSWQNMDFPKLVPQVAGLVKHVIHP